jgi:hypothetical protein
MILGGYNCQGFVRLRDNCCDEGGGGCLHIITRQAFDFAYKCDIAVESAYARGPHGFQQATRDDTRMKPPSFAISWMKGCKHSCLCFREQNREVWQSEQLPPLEEVQNIARLRNGL